MTGVARRGKMRREQAHRIQLQEKPRLPAQRPMRHCEHQRTAQTLCIVAQYDEVQADRVRIARI